MELAKIYTEFDRWIETCISEIQWESNFLIVQQLVQTFFHGCGHSNIASNGHSTLRKLLMATMDYHFVSSNSFWEWLATLHTIHHNPGSCYIPQIVALPQSTSHKLAEENIKTDIEQASKHTEIQTILTWSDSHAIVQRIMAWNQMGTTIFEIFVQGVLWNNCNLYRNYSNRTVEN